MNIVEIFLLLISHEFSGVIDDVEFNKSLDSSSNHLNYDCERLRMALIMYA